MLVFETFLFLPLLLPVLISVAFFTLAERKIMGAIQQRKGPDFVGFGGIMQPIADALKLIIKETIIPSNSNTAAFIISPIITLVLSLFVWSIIPFGSKNFFLNIDLGVLFFFTISSLNVYGVLISGWSSNSKYAFFGAVRSSAQMISYEVVIGLILIANLLSIGSLNLIEIVRFQQWIPLFLPLFPLFLIFLVTILAETNRPPFDLPEAESELVSGFNIEYSSMGFALFFLAEYSSMIIMSILTVIVFLAGWLFPLAVFGDSLILSIKTSFLIIFYLWTRASFPRFRIDQLMRLCWKIFLPGVLMFVILLICALFSFSGTL